jgi:lipoprotein-releasing system permease protein
MSAYELFIGRRYLRSARGNRFVSFISMISMAGIALGVAVLIVVLSVMNGFEHELRDRILSMTSHATITGFNGRVTDWRAVAERARSNSEVVAAAPYVEGQAMLIANRAGGASSASQVYGVLPDDERKVSRLHEHVKTGSFDSLRAGGYGIVLGIELAKKLGVAVGDSVVMIIPQATVTIAGVTPRLRSFKVVGIFQAGMYEYDLHIAYIHMQDANRLYRMGDEISGVRLQVRDLFRASQVARDVTSELQGGYLVDDWTHREQNRFRSIALAKRMLFFIVLLVIGVAAFNIVSTLVMVVKDKQSDIAILRTLGAKPSSVLAIFVTQGTGIGVIGTLAGVALGALLSANLESLIHLLERILNIQFMDAKVYLMSDLPAIVRWSDVFIISATAFGLCCLSTLYPAWRAARTQPAQALRHD